MTTVLKGEEQDRYNKDVYANAWLDSSSHRLESDYYEKDHNRDTLETLLAAPGRRALECGIGTGEFFAMGLARGGKDVYGVDFSDVLLKDCRKRFAMEGYEAKVGLGDVQRLPFRASVFDETFAIGVMPYMHDINVAIAEMMRVTKPGGLVLFDMMNAWHPSQCFNYWYRVVEASGFGFRALNALKTLKQKLGMKTHFKAAQEKVNYRLISPPRMLRALGRIKGACTIRGYNVLLPLDMAILGRHANLCERSKLFSRGLKDNRLLKYFGAKLVIAITK